MDTTYKFETKITFEVFIRGETDFDDGTEGFQFMFSKALKDFLDTQQVPLEQGATDLQRVKIETNVKGIV